MDYDYSIFVHLDRNTVPYIQGVMKSYCNTTGNTLSYHLYLKANIYCHASKVCTP